MGSAKASDGTMREKNYYCAESKAFRSAKRLWQREVTKEGIAEEKTLQQQQRGRDRREGGLDYPKPTWMPRSLERASDGGDYRQESSIVRHPGFPLKGPWCCRERGRSARGLQTWVRKGPPKINHPPGGAAPNQFGLGEPLRCQKSSLF